MNGKTENLVEFYKRNVADVIQDVKTLLERFAEYSRQGGFIQKVIALWKQTNLVLDLHWEEDHINHLIESASRVHSSQTDVLTTVLLVHNHTK
jgi:hypothetical protein